MSVALLASHRAARRRARALPPTAIHVRRPQDGALTASPYAAGARGRRCALVTTTDGGCRRCPGPSVERPGELQRRPFLSVPGWMARRDGCRASAPARPGGTRTDGGRLLRPAPTSSASLASS